MFSNDANESVSNTVVGPACNERDNLNLSEPLMKIIRNVSYFDDVWRNESHRAASKDGSHSETKMKSRKRKARAQIQKKTEKDLKPAANARC